MLKSLLLWLFLALHMFAIDITNGKLTLLELDAYESKALYKDGVTLPLLKHPTKPEKRIAFLSVSYHHHTPIELSYETTQGNYTLHLNFVEGVYPQETLSVEPSKVSPPKEAHERIQKEAAEAKALYATFTPKRFWNTPFEPPIQSFITSEYGTARVFNTTLQSYHSGVDFRAAVGTPIRASNDGVVVLSKERYYAGGSLILDHGEGVYSVYYHLSSLPLSVGTMVKKGDIIGLSGATGRVSGPHLHFGFMVQGVAIAPHDFIAKVNALFE